jgi:hypothetical protein
MPCPSHLDPGMTHYALYRRLCGPHRWCGHMWKTLPPQRFKPWTVQHVLNRYTDYTILAHDELNIKNIELMTQIQNVLLH